jgi:predicted SprT family Zn-dependent metalloprotease
MTIPRALESCLPSSTGLMPWRCPACQTVVRQGDRETDVPRPGQVYRCHVCRLELVLDPTTKKLTVAPFPTEPVSPSKKTA